MFCKSCVRCVELLEDNARVVCGCDDGRIVMVDMLAGRVSNAWKAHDRGVECIAVSSDRKRVVCGSWDEQVKIWDVATGVQVGTPMEGHTDRVRAVAIAPGDGWVVSGSSDGTGRCLGYGEMQLVEKNCSPSGAG